MRDFISGFFSVGEGVPFIWIWWMPFHDFFFAMTQNDAPVIPSPAAEGARAANIPQTHAPNAATPLSPYCFGLIKVYGDRFSEKFT